MANPIVLNSVITSSPVGREAGPSEEFDDVEDTEVVYYTVRGRRRRQQRDAEPPEMFRKLRVWYGTIADQEETAHEGRAVTASGPRFPRGLSPELDWGDEGEAGDTMPMPRFPFAVEGEDAA